MTGLVAACCVVVTLLGVGCRSSESNDGGSVPHYVAEQGEWLYWPQRLRVHPLTRVMPAGEDGDDVIECRIEFLDQHDHSTKCVGRLTVRAVGEVDSAEPMTLAERELDLRDTAVNFEHYDPITQTYLVTLSTPADGPARPGWIEVTFESADGQALRDSADLRWQPE